MPYMSNEKKLLIIATSMGVSTYLAHEYWMPRFKWDSGRKPSRIEYVTGSLVLGFVVGLISATGIIPIMEA